VALTHRCNLRCVLCYRGASDLQARAGSHSATERAEMTTGQVLSVISEVARAGCLFLLITGGEPLLWSDSAEVYRFARSQGFLVTVFTNGPLVSDETVSIP